MNSHRGFTLTELLVVLAIIAIATAAATSIYSSLSRPSLDQGARELQAALRGAQDRAVLINRPAGIRLLPDPAFPIHRLPNGQIDPAYPLVYNRWIPIESPPDYSEGLIVPAPQRSTAPYDPSLQQP